MLRPATRADSMTLWRIRNQPDVRLVSKTTDRIPWDVHEAWLARALADPDVRLGIWEHQTQPAGYGRLVLTMPGMAEVSIAVDTLYRRRGIASGILDALKGWARAEGRDDLYASVAVTNAASLRLFIAAGYIPEEVYLEDQRQWLSLWRPTHDCRLCAEDQPFHSVGRDGISDGNRMVVADLHEVLGAGGAELLPCTR